MRPGWPHVIRHSVQIHGGNLIRTILQRFISLTPTTVRSAAVSVFYHKHRHTARPHLEKNKTPLFLKGIQLLTYSEDLVLQEFNVNSDDPSPRKVKHHCETITTHSGNLESKESY